MPSSRRRFLAAAALLGVPASALRAQSARAPTPAMTEGPFYPESFSAAPQTDLVRGPLMGRPVPLALGGRILDRFGKPVAGARVEIWQCDGLGRYTHSRDSRPEDRDANFAGFGWMLSDAGGRYAFATIRPLPYTGRTPHIHFAVRAPKARALVTQMFVEGEPANANDFLYRSLGPAARALVTVRPVPAGAGERAEFDLVVA
ncbi:MAG: intradiol ring-cleavage dioxygenase [Burkholderiales bacterium]|nr:intradiol ring-cleavage dioxygenase [Burkholderiales bacterium]